MNEPTPPNRRGTAVPALLAALALAGCASLAPATTSVATISSDMPRAKLKAVM